MASLNNVVNVSLLPQGRQVARDNMNVVAIMTSQVGTLNSNNRYGIYRDISAVAADFGTYSDTYDFASAFFNTRPNPIGAAGVLVIGYWRAASEDVAASAAKLVGAQLVTETVIDQLQSVSDGAFDIDVDGVTESLSALDFRIATSLDDVVDIIDAGLTGATATLSDDGLSIVITSNTTGALSALTYATAPASGTFVGNLLGLAEGNGNTLTQGAAASTLTAETKVQAVTELKSLVNFKGAMFIGKPTDAEAEDLAEWAGANSVLMYDVFSSADNLEVDVTNPVWAIKLASLTNYRMMYSKANNRKMAASYMARMHVVNFNAENSALTMNLKELSVPAEEYSETEIVKAQRVGLDLYTTFKDVPKLLTSGANDFTDNPYNLIAYIDAVQTDVFNILGGTATKIPQTRRGVNQLIDQCEKTTRGFVRAGVFAPGTWSSPDFFGDQDTFNRNIEENGFYWLAQPLADQPQSEREARISPVLQGAVKNAGAVHRASIIINFNI